MRTPATAALAATLMAAAAARAGSNDTCDMAEPIAVPSSTIGSTVGATPDAVPPCALATFSGGVWYRLTGTGTEITVSTCNAGTNFDTVLAVYCDNCEGLQCVVSNDDACTGGPPSTRSTVSWCAAPGHEYLILLRGYLSFTGTFQLDVTDDGIPCLDWPVCGEDCATAMPLEVPSSTLATTVGAAPEAVPFCAAVTTSGGAWYSVAGTGHTMTASTCNDGGDFDTVLEVFCPGCEELRCVAANDDECRDGPSGFLSTVSWCSESDQEYLILVSGYLSGQGLYRLDILDDGLDCADPPSCTAPLNDDCPDAFLVEDGAIAFTTIDATTDGPPLPKACAGAGGELNSDVWFLYAPPCDGVLTASTCGAADFDTRVAVYLHSDDCGALELLGCNDDAPGCGSTSQVEVPVACGAPVLIRVGGPGALQGSGTLTLSCTGGSRCPPPCPADIDGSGEVDVQDLVALILAWDTADPDADINGDGTVDVLDLTQMVLSWGKCF